ncbi:hypothetical protein [Nocardia paucivorans]|uniref:hypothetical protein n=1 Tax=Nocardia paucivorans TaxID=114259 RepID=UPI000302E9B4|nr:hypothetical protein [Nocardia paucivorans]
MIDTEIRPEATGPGTPVVGLDLTLLYAEVDAIMVEAEARAPIRLRQWAPPRLIPPRVETKPWKPVRRLRGRPPPGPRPTQRAPPA